MTHMTMANIKRAVELLKAGKLVAFPTETVYGLGADASNKEAIGRVFAAKKRPKTHPLIVHLANASQLSDWARDISTDAIKLAKACWPGPLTIICAKQPWVLDELTGGQDTVAIRVPKHPIANALLEAFGSGVAAPSANQFTHVSPTNAAAVKEELGETVDIILDGGMCDIGLESTILDLSKDKPTLLRPGMLSHSDLEAALGKSIHQTTSLSSVRVPGMHALHYAPVTETLLLSTPEIEAYLSHAPEREVALITYQQPAFSLPPSVRQFKLSDDPQHYAHDLYDTLRQADHLGVASIIIQAVPHHPLWDAICDRIQKASGKK